MQQELALAPRGVVVPRALGVLLDVDVLEPRLTAVDRDVAVEKRRPALPQRLDLGAAQHQSRLEHVQDEVVMPGLAVAGDDLAASLLRHGYVVRSARARGAPRTDPPAPCGATSQVTRVRPATSR
ncbi:hypothetical protein D3C74_378390 [compost metagenome]